MSKVIRISDKTLIDIGIIRDSLHDILCIDKDLLPDDSIINAALRYYIEVRLNDLYFKVKENDDYLPFE